MAFFPQASPDILYDAWAAARVFLSARFLERTFSSDFTLPRFNTVTHGKHSVRFLGPKLWSKLPKNNRDAESLNVFKNE